MPLMEFRTLPLEESRKDDLAAKIYDCVLPYLHIPHIDIYFHEFNRYWQCGRPVSKPAGTFCTIEGPDLPPVKIEEMSAKLTALLRKEMDDDRFYCTLVYHVNDHDHVSLNGELLSTCRRPPKNKA